MERAGARPSEEASEKQLRLAREQGEALSAAVEEMIEREAHDGGERAVGDYLVGYAVEKAEGMYERRDGELVWEEPGDANVHVEVSVRDAADGRFVPGLRVEATLVAPDGSEVGTHEQPFLWHPWLHHYGRNWTVPGDGTYRLKVHIDPPAWGRHDRENGRRLAEAVDVDFESVEIATGQK